MVLIHKSSVSYLLLKQKEVIKTTSTILFTGAPPGDLPAFSAPYQLITQVTCTLGFGRLCSCLMPSARWTCAKLLGQSFSVGSHTPGGEGEDRACARKQKKTPWGAIKFPINFAAMALLDLPLTVPHASQLKKRLLTLPVTLTVSVLRGEMRSGGLRGTSRAASHRTEKAGLNLQSCWAFSNLVAVIKCDFC